MRCASSDATFQNAWSIPSSKIPAQSRKRIWHSKDGATYLYLGLRGQRLGIKRDRAARCQLHDDADGRAAAAAGGVAPLAEGGQVHGEGQGCGGEGAAGGGEAAAAAQGVMDQTIDDEIRGRC